MPFSTAGPLLESHCAFPEKVNAEFVQKLGKSHFRIKVWERGAGPTLACGTGACATGKSKFGFKGYVYFPILVVS